MRRTVALFALTPLVALLLVTAAEAKRARRTPVNTPTGVVVDGPQLAAYGKGFAVCRNADLKGEIVACDADGKNPRTLVSAKAPISAWSPSPKEGVIAWISGGKLFLRSTPDGEELDLGLAEPVRPAFSRDGKIVAFVSKGNLVLRDTEGERRREIAPREGRVIEGIDFAGDGKWMMALTAPVTKDARAPVDTIERLDSSEESPDFEPLQSLEDGRFRSVCVSPVDDQVAFVEGSEKDSESVLHVLALSTGIRNEFGATGDFREIAFSADGRWLLQNLGGVIHMQQLFRSGTARSFYREILTVGDGKADSRPVAGKGGMWFLRGKPGGTLEVVKAELD
ncbi:MAG: hypothetical protein AAB074_13800 [Planctomycetota bacterium]